MAKTKEEKDTSKEALAETPNHELGSFINFEADAGAGSESMDKDDFAIPRLSILQALSPQVKKKDAAYVEGAEEGQIFDAVSQSVRDGEEGITIIPVTYRKTFIEWKLRETGGGFVADHGKEGAALLGQCKKDKNNNDILPSGNQLVATAEYFVMVVENNGFSPYVISMTSSQLKISRRWNTMINQLRVHKSNGGGTFNPAMFYQSYLLQTTPESSTKGDYFNWKITTARPVLELDEGESIYIACRDLRESVTSGQVKAAAPATESSEEDDDIPM